MFLYLKHYMIWQHIVWYMNLIFIEVYNGTDTASVWYKISCFWIYGWVKAWKWTIKFISTFMPNVTNIMP